MGRPTDVILRAKMEQMRINKNVEIWQTQLLQKVWEQRRAATAREEVTIPERAPFTTIIFVFIYCRPNAKLVALLVN